MKLLIILGLLMNTFTRPSVPKQYFRTSIIFLMFAFDVRALKELISNSNDAAI